MTPLEGVVPWTKLQASACFAMWLKRREGDGSPSTPEYIYDRMFTLGLAETLVALDLAKLLKDLRKMHRNWGILEQVKIAKEDHRKPGPPRDGYRLIETKLVTDPRMAALLCRLYHYPERPASERELAANLTKEWGGLVDEATILWLIQSGVDREFIEASPAGRSAESQFPTRLLRCSELVDQQLPFLEMLANTLHLRRPAGQESYSEISLAVQS